MGKAFVIIRVSSQDQLKGYGPDVQWCDDVLPNAARLGLEVDELHRRVIQESATSWDRTKFEAAMKEAMSLFAKGEIDSLLFPRVDRETRFIYSSFPLLCEVIKVGLRVFFGREGFELQPDNPESTERYLTKAMQSESYIRTMTANTTKAKRKLVDKGILPIGTGKGLYGFKWDKERKRRIVLEYEAKVVERVFTMLARKVGCSTVARELNSQGVPSKSGGKWCPRTIYNMAHNPAYAGITYYGRTRGSTKTKLIRVPESEWKLLPNATPAIISEELFDRVQEIFRQNREIHKAKATHDYLLRGHVRCAYCGSPLVGSFLNHLFRYYHCRGTYSTAQRAKECNAKYVRADDLEEGVWKDVRQVLEKPDIVLAGVKEQIEAEQKGSIHAVFLDKEIEKLRRQAKSYDAQVKRLVQLFRYEEVDRDVLLDELNQAKEDRKADSQRLENLVKSKERIEQLEHVEIKLTDYCNRLNGDLDSASFQDKRDVLDMLAIVVTVSDKAVSIDGIIPLDNAVSQACQGVSEPTHHWTNMGITTCT